MAGEMYPRLFSGNGRCERARQWSSLRVDNELSELENALLEKHLEACGECRSFDAQLHSTAELLRTASADAPAVGFRIPSPETVRFPVSRRLAFAGLALAAALGSLVGSTLNRPAVHESPAPQVSFLTSDLNQLRQLPRQQHVAPLAPSRAPGGPPEGII